VLKIQELKFCAQGIPLKAKKDAKKSEKMYQNAASPLLAFQTHKVV
jgi:hypothetical protein